MPKIKVGVFDSGVGGAHVAHSIEKAIPGVKIVLKEDKAHLPYGNRDIEEIYSFIKPIFQEFIDEGCQVVVVACNTVTTNLIGRLRQEFPILMVGMEPMVKPAAKKTRSKIIGVCATPRTLSSERYKWLKETYAQKVKVLEPDCGDWALMIEGNTLDREIVAKTIENLIAAGADEIVLGCTHYHWIEAIIKDIASGRAEVIHPEKPTIEQLKKVLLQLP
ncbi:MAG TPA: aspartate/glutamate racemase family protein [Candidatus Saccharimonadales bacterium]|nr:aspartate/glutamate racemase family protein [Candidatus Saccharimonadales bacterium]